MHINAKPVDAAYCWTGTGEMQAQIPTHSWDSLDHLGPVILFNLPQRIDGKGKMKRGEFCASISSLEDKQDKNGWLDRDLNASSWSLLPANNSENLQVRENRVALMCNCCSSRGLLCRYVLACDCALPCGTPQKPQWWMGFKWETNPKILKRLNLAKKNI